VNTLVLKRISLYLRIGEEEQALNTGQLLRAVFYGLAIIYVIAAVFSLIFSLLLKFTSLNESSLSFIITAISFICLFIGGFVAGGKGKEKGWLLGGLTGGLYTLINFFYQYLGFDTIFTTTQMIFYGCFIITAIIGGIIGVNIVSGNKPKEV